jgi:hypothetical protein
MTLILVVSSVIFYCYAECRYVECRYAERRDAEIHCTLFPS